MRVGLVNERNSTVDAYGITATEATEVIVMSAETYCPDQVALVMQALS